MKVSIILPTFNEAGNIAKLIKTVKSQPRLTQLALEFVVIDDDSPDGTAKMVSSLGKKYLVKLIVRKKQRGLATAILAGIKKSTGEIVVLMDTDFNHQPKDIAKLIKPIIGNQADLVIGSRYIAGGGMHKAEAGKLQFLGSRYGNLVVNRVILGLPVHESLSGFVALRKKVLTKLPLKLIFQGYGDYCIRLLYLAHKKGFKLAEVPVVYGKRQYGESKSHLLAMFVNYFKTALELKLTTSRRSV
jgi:dolichol-phosphate mannosyltransferase